MTDGYIRCPFCAEKIKPEAKKCKHCGEWLFKNKHKSIFNSNITIKTYLIIWILSIIVFWFCAIAFESNENLIIPLLIAVLIGIVAFLGLFTESLKGLFEKEKRKSSLKYLLSIPIVLILLFAIPGAGLNYYQENIKKPGNLCGGDNIKCIALDGANLGCMSHDACELSKKERALKGCSDGLISCSIDGERKCLPLDECNKQIGSQEVVASNSNSTNNTFATNNPDSPVHCNIHESCGGGTKPLTKAECEQITCCNVNGSWRLENTQKACYEAQGRYLPSLNEKKVQFISTEGVVDGSYYCYESKVNELTRIENEIKVLEFSADGCNISQGFKNNSCRNEECPINHPDWSPEWLSTCLENCSAKTVGTCLPKYEEVGNQRKELHRLINKYCP